jgi:hypothetical protein
MNRFDQSRVKPVAGSMTAPGPWPGRVPSIVVLFVFDEEDAVGSLPVPD